MMFPDATRAAEMTRLLLDRSGPGLPVVRWAGSLRLGRDDPGLLAAAGAYRGSPLLVEHSRPSYSRPGLRGHRLAGSAGSGDRDVAGRDWSTALRA